MIFSLYHDTIIVDIYITDIFMPTLYCNIPMGRQMQRGGMKQSARLSHRNCVMLHVTVTEYFARSFKVIRNETAESLLVLR